MCKNISFDTLFDTVGQKMEEKNQLDQCIEKLQGITLFQDVSASMTCTFFIYYPKDLAFDNLFDTISQIINKLT